MEVTYDWTTCVQTTARLDDILYEYDHDCDGELIDAARIPHISPHRHHRLRSS